jgi:sirohydrochlorin ferrochelatase
VLSSELANFIMRVALSEVAVKMETDLARVLLIGSNLGQNDVGAAKAKRTVYYKGGSSLPGIKSDIAKMSQLLSETKIPTKEIYSDNLAVESFWAAIDELLDADRHHPTSFVIYYSGHGREGDGAWCLGNSQFITPTQLGLKWSGMI